MSNDIESAKVAYWEEEKSAIEQTKFKVKRVFEGKKLASSSLREHSHDLRNRNGQRGWWVYLYSHYFERDA